jgi:hypothetical protein
MSVKPLITGGAPQGPIIPGDITLHSNQTELMDIYNMYNSDTITNKTITFSEGIVSGIALSPITISSAVNKSYVDTLYGNKPGNPLNSVQYKIDTDFVGSSALTYEESDFVGTLTINGSITSGSSSLTGSILTGLQTPPTLDNQAATKDYVDIFPKKLVTNISSVTGVTYTAAEVVNGIIIREGITVQTNTTVTPNVGDIFVRTVDKFPTAVQIFNRLIELGINPITGTTFSFNIYNNNEPNGAASLIVQAFNNSVTFDPPDITIFGSYQLSARCIVTGVSIPAILVIVDNNSYVSSIPFITPGLNDPQWSLLTNTNSVRTTIVRTDVQCILPMSPKNYPEDKSITYFYSDISGKIIVRGLSLTTDITDTICSTSEFLSDSFFSSFNETGLGMEFAIQNVSSSKKIYLIGSTGWIFDENVTINPGYTGLFNITISGSVCTLYVIGYFNRA